MAPKISASPPVEKSTPKPPPKPTRPITASQRPSQPVDVASVAAEQERLYAAAESILEAMATGYQPTAGEWAVLRRVGPPESGSWHRNHTRTDKEFDRWVKHRVTFLQRRSRWQTQAGSAADRQTAAKRLQDAENKLATRGEEIAAELERLQQERLELEHKARAAQVIVDRQEQAVQSLMSTDAHFSHAILDEIRALERQRGAALRPAKSNQSQIHDIDRMLALNPLENDDDHSAVVHRICAEWRDTVCPDPYHLVVSAPGWQTYVNHCKARKAALEQEIAEVESDDAIADLDEQIQRLRSVYVPA